jgi:hypothetical protein
MATLSYEVIVIITQEANAVLRVWRGLYVFLIMAENQAAYDKNQ